MQMQTPHLHVLIPAFNEAPALAQLLPALVSASAGIPKWQLNICIVDDGSTDNTAAWLRTAASQRSELSFIRLSRNFGKEAAMLAGLDALAPTLAADDVVIVMDGDGQDPPDHLTAMLDTMTAQNADLVIAVRASRESESAFKTVAARCFQTLMRWAGDVPMPRGASDFCAMRPQVVRAITQVREVNRFFKGITEWVGFRVATAPYAQAARIAGETKWGTRALSSYAVRGLLAYSKAPLRAVTLLGLAMALLAFAYGAFIVMRTLFYGEPVRGYPTLMVTVLALGGAQLLALGVIGEYLGRTLDEVRRRPLYLIAEQSEPVRAKSAP